MTNIARTPSVLAACGMLALAMILGGCESLNPQKPDKIITVHEIIRYPRGMKELEKQVPTFSGQSIWINANPFLHSKSIKSVELLPNAESPEFFDLKLDLDRHGALVWMQLSVGLTRQSLAFVVDGVYYRSFRIDEHTSEADRVVIIKGPFDKVTAEALKKHAKSNYQYYNQDDKPTRFGLMDDDE
jgi:hypothetical protein